MNLVKSFHFADDFHLCQFIDPVNFLFLEGFQEGNDVITVCPARIEIELYGFLAIDDHGLVVMDVSFHHIQHAIRPIAHQEVNDILSVVLLDEIIAAFVRLLALLKFMNLGINEILYT